MVQKQKRIDLVDAGAWHWATGGQIANVVAMRLMEGTKGSEGHIDIWKNKHAAAGCCPSLAQHCCVRRFAANGRCAIAGRYFQAVISLQVTTGMTFDGAVARSNVSSHCIACARLLPHISCDG
jgi:hypothetical protein